MSLSFYILQPSLPVIAKGLLRFLTIGMEILKVQSSDGSKKNMEILLDC